MTDFGTQTATHVNGAELVPDPSGALFWPDQSLLIFADLHLEKGSSFSERGVALPPYDTRATLLAMAAACAKYAPRRIVCLGDSFHDGGAWDRIAPDDAADLRALTQSHDWIWIAGNHDPAPPATIGGDIMEIFERGPLNFRHEPAAGSAPGEIAGHLHPCARVRIRGRHLRRRCFVTDGMRLILPAFGAYTGGLDVLDRAFTHVFPHTFHAWMLAKNTVYPVLHTRLAHTTHTR